jgi:hypothetical protein
MSKKIYESKVAADAARRFRMLCEYSFNIAEDDGEEAPEMNDQEGVPNEGNDEGMPNDMNMPANGGDMPQNGGMEPEGDMPQGDNANMEGGAPGFNPEEGAGSESGNQDMPGMEGEPMQDDDEVIDVDELTQSQEETEEKVEDIHVTMEKGFDKLPNIVNKLDKMIDASTSNMEQIRQEIEKRNPTPVEKLNMRAANDSYPFNVSPSEYWKEKEMTSNYRIGGDENEGDAKQYTITQGDIDKITDFRTISKDLNDSEFNQNLLNIFGLR